MMSSLSNRRLSHSARGAVALVAGLTLFLFGGCAKVVGPRVGIVADDYSKLRSKATQEADLAYCEELAAEVKRDYGPRTSGTDFSAASENMSYITRYTAECMRVKGYSVEGSFGRGLEAINLPDPVLEKIKADQQGDD